MSTDDPFKNTREAIQGFGTRSQASGEELMRGVGLDIVDAYRRGGNDMISDLEDVAKGYPTELQMDLLVIAQGLRIKLNAKILGGPNDA